MEIIQINNLPNDVYHNSDEYKPYWSSSNLKVYYSDTPREAYYRKFVAEKEQSDAMDFGNMLHDFLSSKHINGQPFEYNEFEPPVHLTGKYKGQQFGKNTDAYKNAFASVKNAITPDDMQAINDIWTMLKGHEDAWYIFEKILRQGIAEPSFFVNGMHKYKYRPDDLTDELIADWKSLAKMYWSVSGLKRRVFSLGYHITAAMYQYFEHLRTGIWKPFIIVWLMKEPPYDLLIDDISRFAFELIGDNQVIPNAGAKIFLAIKDQHEACQLANHWPGLSAQFNSIGGVRMADYLANSYQEGSFSEFDVETNKF